MTVCYCQTRLPVEEACIHCNECGNVREKWLATPPAALILTSHTCNLLVTSGPLFVHCEPCISAQESSTTMASEFIGYTILVTLSNPPNAQIQGIVSNVVDQKLHLQNGE